MSASEAPKKKAAQHLMEDHIFAFGLSKRANSAHFHSTEMALTPLGNSRHLADGGKNYIGNGNEAPWSPPLARTAS